MRAILVCVDYGDILSLTLPYNRHHFNEVMVVTTDRDTETIAVAKQNDAQVYCTNSFYSDGAAFNKWRALEEGLDAYGRNGLICLMDADICWPKVVQHQDYLKGYLYSPTRRVCEMVTDRVPNEVIWPHFRPYVDYEWAGYTQIFHADDPSLPEAPWHAINWSHAGGADSGFQNRWRPDLKVRPNWQVLHLGPPYHNWCGRASRRVDGTFPPEAGARVEKLRGFLRGRNSGGLDPFAHEKIKF